MVYIALSRKWRPQRFDDVVGQTHVVRTLQNVLRTNRVHHAYLFSGPRGVGKTTMARIFAKALNCTNRVDAEPCNECDSCVAINGGHSLDVVEIDAASNNGVDDIRELRENVKLATVSSRYRVFIVDEAHMLSMAAWNAFLKTLEEPPSHVVFIFASTEKNRFPATILSRCQQFEFQRMTYDEVVTRLRELLASEAFDMDDDGLALIAQQSEGCLRDAQSLLEQLIAYSDGSATVDDVSRMLGYGSAYAMARLTNALVERNAREALDASNDLANQGADLPQCLRLLVTHFHRLLRLKVSPELAATIEASPSKIAELSEQSNRISIERVRWALKTLMRAERDIKTLGYESFNFELALVDVCRLEDGVPLDDVLASLESLESRLGNGVVEASPIRDVTEQAINTASARPLPNDPVKEATAEPTESSVADDTPTAVRPELTPDYLDTLWSETHKRIAAMDVPLLGSMNGTRLEMRGNQLAVVFNSRVKLNLANAKRAFVEQILSDLHGSRLRVVFAVEEAELTARVDVRRDESPEDATRNAEQMILAVFNGKMP
jgi:DNA polymerase-3 subunit gamma/tau